ncbi:MAG: hypothetical protein VKJ24_02865 [Synechococcales bacterium]|nr:hypothetical protein [Synechococcales bacterium]
MSQRPFSRKSPKGHHERSTAAPESRTESHTEHRWVKPKGHRENSGRSDRSSHPNLIRLIEQDAPLQHHTYLVLMYGPFQAEMAPGINQGVATWLKSCLNQHGIPSLVRFDYRQRAQVFRRDQFQPWFEQLLKAG